MSTQHCEHEAAVTAAVQTGHWTDDLRRHADTCPVCAEVVLVAGLLQHEAELISDEQPLPDPEYVWWRAQLRARQEASRRATMTITVLQVISWVCGAALALALLVWSAPAFLQSFGRLLPSSLASTASSGMAQPWLVLIISAGAILFLMLLDRSSHLISE